MNTAFNSKKLIHEGERMTTEIPIWVNGEIRWLSGIDKKTTCKDIVEVLLEKEGIDKSEIKDYTIMERWRKVERPLDDESRILKIWSHWGYEKKEVRLCLRRIDNEVDSGRGSPAGSGNIPSMRRRRHRLRGNPKPSLTYPEGLHPRRLAEISKYNRRNSIKEEYDAYHLRKLKEIEANDETQNQSYLYDDGRRNYEEIYNNNNNNNNNNNENANRKRATQKSYHCSSTGRLHSTLLSDCTNTKSYNRRATKCCSKRDSKHKIRNSENIEKLMKLILAQGVTIRNQLQKLKERDEQIESIEQERHRERIEKNGRNYLLETYLGSLKEAEIPVEMDEERAEDSGVNTEVGSDQLNARKKQETEHDSDKYLDEGYRHKEGNNQLYHSPVRLHQKTIRSKSESRTNESKPELNLKRTLSDNSIVEAKNTGNNNTEKIVKTISDAKEDPDDIVELKKIRSQIEMWEKVFKINKKLEKEEENLVRLHIKIKKIQKENYRFAKDEKASEKNTIEKNGEINEFKKPNEMEENNCEQSCTEIQKSLETLKSDLENNSQEIYQNFTKLIEEDEKMKKKQNNLTKLLSDLERTKHEKDMLQEMISTSEQQLKQIIPLKESSPTLEVQENQNSLSCIPHEDRKTEVDNDHSIHQMPNSFTANNSKISNLPLIPYTPLNHHKNMEHGAQEDGKLMKPKIVKISFEDKIERYEDLESSQEKLLKEPGAAVGGTLKGILKNRQQNYAWDTGHSNVCHESEDYKKFTYGNEFDGNDFYLYNRSQTGNIDEYKHDLPNRVPNLSNYIYSHTIYTSTPKQIVQESNYNYFTPPPYQSQEDIKTAYTLKNPLAHEIPQNQVRAFTQSAMGRTKATVLNDNDSSTSSDTSGLCSMYSSSPTVEEHYIENGYILDTLV